MNLAPLRFMKMSGAGNTFVLASPEPAYWDTFKKQTGHSAADFAKMICDPVLGIQADGLLILLPGSAKDADYVWEFFNSDGSGAEMCGNAARCATLYAYEILTKKTKSHFTFQTGAGLVQTMVLGNDLIRVSMPKVTLKEKKLILKTEKSSEEFCIVDSGVPHAVQKIFAFKDATDLKDMAKEVRNHDLLKPAGANVTFYSVDSKNAIHAVTYERGVEDYTLACGTGAVAAAFVHHTNGAADNIQVTMPGGSLRVFFPADQPRPLMEGEAVFVGEFHYSLEVFL